MNKRSKRSYLAWQVNEVSSSSNEEQAHMILMVSYYSNDDNKVSNNQPSYDELHYSFRDECLNLYRLCTKRK